MNDSPSLHWLKEFPSWLTLAILFLIVLFVYIRYQIDFLQRIVDLLAGGLLTTLIGTRKSPTTNVQADTVQTPNLNTDSMDNSVVNIGTDSEVTMPEKNGEI